MCTNIALTAGRARLELDATGRIDSLFLDASSSSLLAPNIPSHLITFRVFGDARAHVPTSVREIAAGGDVRRLEFTSEAGVTLMVEVTERDTHARLTLVAARDASGACPVEVFHWGPLVTSLTEPLGQLIGLVRSGGLSIGMLSLEAGTDGAMVKEPGPGGKYWFPLWAMAGYTDEGRASWLKAEARDHTRDGVGVNFTAIRGEPGRTVVGSAVALYGCATADELDVIEHIELAEDLPHPMDAGIWMKRSPLARRPDLWIYFDEKSVAERIELARRFGGGYLCSFLDMLGNWGHFEPDPGAWPSGFAGLRAAAEKAREADVRLVLYTLTCFLKPMTIPEPYIAPVPDDRLQTMGPATVLAEPVDAAATTIVLENRPGLAEVLQTQFEMGDWLANYQENNAIRLDNEIFYYAGLREEGDLLILEGCHRGIFDTTATAHARGAKAVRLYLIWYRNMYPGTLDMMDEVADRIAASALAGGFGRIQFDGHESCTETGHGIYARNRMTRRVYDQVKDRIPIFEGSNLGNYDWHVISFIRWGEWDQAKGFRGTMLDSRIERQIMMRHNLMPNGLGQYYPSDATVEDVEWLMARAAGWNAGFDYHIHDHVLARNPEREALLDTTRLWVDAIAAGAFTPAQQRELRQTDRLYNLARDADGGWRLTFRKRWQHPTLKALHSSVFTTRAIAGGTTVEPCGIDWSWTHNPGIYVTAGLSDDLVWRTSAGEGVWSVTWPAAEGETTDTMQMVIRLDPDAPCGVRNPVVRFGADVVMRLPVTLEPGQYLSIVHEAPWVSVYNAHHEVVAEGYFPVCGPVASAAPVDTFPAVARGAPQRIALSAEPVHTGCDVILRMNLRTHERIKA